MSLVTTTIKRKHFDAILSGQKKIEYREVKPYWTRRLENRDVSMLRLHAGYSSKAPRLIVGVTKVERVKTPSHLKNFGAEVYAIHLGNADLI